MLDFHPFITSKETVCHAGSPHSGPELDPWLFSQQQSRDSLGAEFGRRVT